MIFVSSISLSHTPLFGLPSGLLRAGTDLESGQGASRTLPSDAARSDNEQAALCRAIVGFACVLPEKHCSATARWLSLWGVGWEVLTRINLEASFWFQHQVTNWWSQGQSKGSFQ